MGIRYSRDDENERHLCLIRHIQPDQEVTNASCSPDVGAASAISVAYLLTALLAEVFWVPMSYRKSMMLTSSLYSIGRFKFMALIDSF